MRGLTNTGSNDGRSIRVLVPQKSTAQYLFITFFRDEFLNQAWTLAPPDPGISLLPGKQVSGPPQTKCSKTGGGSFSAKPEPV